MRALSRKLLRDLLHLRGQVLAISLVVACGVAVFVSTRTAYDSLVMSRATYYGEYRFADVFASLKRAPELVAARLAAIAGVAAVETRIVFDVTLDVPGLAEPATGRIVSIPEHRTPMLNDLYMRRGRYVEGGRRDEVLVGEAFALANHLDLGDTLGAVLNGRWQRLRVVGIVLSPEYVYEIRGSDIFPDNRRFGVLWMSRDAVGPAFDMDGAFNDVVLALEPDAVEADVIAQLDRLLERYGGLGAYGRADQISNRFLSDEIAQNRIFGIILPVIFLGVAAFLLNIVLSRLVSMQRDQIAVLKAFGYAHRTVAFHYFLFALVIVLIGAVLGTGVGLWLGKWVNRMYVDFYRFPILRYVAGPSVIVLAIGVAGGAAILGALGAVVARMHPLPLDPRTRAEAQARLEAAEATRRAADARGAQARATLQQAQRSGARARELGKTGTIGREERELADLAETARRRELEAAEFAARAAEYNVEAARAVLLAPGSESAQAFVAACEAHDGACLELRAPITGRVLRLPEKSERVVAAGMPLLELGDPTALEIVVDILSADAVKVKPGAPMLVEDWGGDQPLHARVRLVEPSGFTKLSALGVEEQRVNVIGDFVRPPVPLADGYRIEARIVVWQTDAALKLPASAIFRRAGAWNVFVIDGGRAQHRTVDIGQRSTTEVQVLNGLTEGTEVVLHPSDQVEDGVRVTPL